MRLEMEEGMHRPAELSARDPRRLSRTIAPKSPPPTAEIAVQKSLDFDQFEIYLKNIRQKFDGNVRVLIYFLYCCQ